MKLSLLAVLAAGLLPVNSAATETVTSPSGLITVNFDVKAGGVPVYNVSFKGKEVIKDSRLGLEYR